MRASTWRSVNQRVDMTICESEVDMTIYRQFRRVRHMDDFTSGHYVTFNCAPAQTPAADVTGKHWSVIESRMCFLTELRHLCVVVAHSSKAEQHRVGNNYTSAVSVVIQQQHVQSKTRIGNHCTPFCFARPSHSATYRDDKTLAKRHEMSHIKIQRNNIA